MIKDQGRSIKSTRNPTTSLKTTYKNDKSTILISINPQHVRNIFNCSKKYEYRKRIAKNVKKIVIYETTPTKRVVGEVEVIKTIGLKPNQLWNQTKKYSGINKMFFNAYFAGKSIAYAYRLGAIKRYGKPKTLAQFNLKAPPQSYIYIFS